MAVNEDKAREVGAEQRKRFAQAWNETMLDIWRDRIAKLGIIRTGAMYNSLQAIPVKANGRFESFEFSHLFLLYGIYVDNGVGREVFRGNQGDIGREKVRERKRWFSTAYFSSMYNLRDFLSDNIGKEFQGIMSNVFNVDI